MTSFGASIGTGVGHHTMPFISQGPYTLLCLARERGHDVADAWSDGWRSDADTIGAGLFWWEHLYDFIALLRANGIEPLRERRRERPVIILGGNLVSLNPATVLDIADIVCVGDGEESYPAVLDVLGRGGAPADCDGIPGVLVCSRPRRVRWQSVPDISSSLRFCYWRPRFRYAKSGVRRLIGRGRRIEIARGCPHKCAYCAVSWTKPYREASAVAISECIMAHEGGEIIAFAPSPREHSGWPVIAAALERRGLKNTAMDARASAVLEAGSVDSSRVHVFGIDALSERLRRAVLKPMSREDFARLVGILSAHEGSMQVFLILDLPGERESDYVEWWETLRDAESACAMRAWQDRRSTARGVPRDRFYVVVTLNAFSPQPHTPMQWEGIDYARPLRLEYGRHMSVIGPRERRRLWPITRGYPHGPLSRVLESAAVRGDAGLTQFFIDASCSRKRMRVPGDAMAMARRFGCVDALRWTMARKSIAEGLPWRKLVETTFEDIALARAAAAVRARCDAG